MRDLNHISYCRADLLYKRGRLKAAEKWFKFALKNWPQDCQCYWALGDIYSELKKPKKALVLYSKAINLAPKKDLADLNYNLGNAFFDQGRYHKAIACYHKVPSNHLTAILANRNIELAKNKLKNIK